MNYKEIYEKWLNNPNVLSEQKEELRNMADQQIKDAFYTDVAFGTAGMCGLMGLGPNRLNIYTIRDKNGGDANAIVCVAITKNASIVTILTNSLLIAQNC